MCSIALTFKIQTKKKKVGRLWWWITYHLQPLPPLNPNPHQPVLKPLSCWQLWCEKMILFRVALWHRLGWYWGRHEIKKSLFKIDCWLLTSINTLEQRNLLHLDIFASCFLEMDTNTLWIIYFCCLIGRQSLYGSTEKQLRLVFSVGWMSELHFHSSCDA